jgi:hypothetical protein
VASRFVEACGCASCGDMTYPCDQHRGAVFASGAKSSEEKPRFDLIPVCALEREAVRMAEGAKAHGENNYQQGVNDPAFVRDRINHLIAHALNYAAGDRSDDHLAAIRANCGMLMWIESQR